MGLGLWDRRRCERCSRPANEPVTLPLSFHPSSSLSSSSLSSPSYPLFFLFFINLIREPWLCVWYSWNGDTVCTCSPNFPCVLYIGYFVWVIIMTPFVFDGSPRNPIRNHHHHPSLMMTSVVGGGKGVKQGIWQRRTGWAARWQYLGTLGNTCRGLIVPHTILFYKTKTKKDYKHKKRQNEEKDKTKQKKDKYTT